MRDNLKRDVAVATAASIVEVFAPLLRAEERKEAFEQVLERIKAGLTWFETKRKRKALKPSRN